MKLTFELTPSQSNFLYSRARHPAFVGGWNVGKTFVALTRSIIYTEKIPDNLGIIFRKTARSLHDSTLRDFESYTNLSVDSDRNYAHSNGSVIMFRHLDEIDSINQQNINLGWFYIEQGDELDSSREFFMLFGRLRRDVIPTEEFLKLQLPFRSGWVIGNAGDHWMLPLWKEKRLEESLTEEMKKDCPVFAQLIESETIAPENQRFMKPDFKVSISVLEKNNPMLYRQYIKNDWSVAFRNVVFSSELLNHMYGRHGLITQIAKSSGVAVDPAGEGVDDNVFMSGKGGDVTDVYTQTIMAPSSKAIHAVEMCKQIDGDFIIVDCDGLGIETYQELKKLNKDYLQGIEIIKFHGSAASEMKEGDRLIYLNLRSEAAFTAQRRGWNGKAGVNPKDTVLIEELKADEYETQRGYLKLIDKKDIKEKLGRSPGRADCWKMLQWAFEKNIKRKEIYPHRAFSNLPREADTAYSVFAGKGV